ncbi:MAG: ACP S-malonyltransferase [Acidimicrobiia bacterium]|nr:ACP S-malonyltransferase [Acidimicrobiia bacterium]
MMIAFTFPGQGSQKPGMGEPWTDHPSWEVIDEASDAAGRDISALLLTADADELRETGNSQLATYALSMVALDAVSRVGAEGAGFAGHSLGEYSALTAAGVLQFEDAVRLVGERGDAMQAAADERSGTMAAVLGLDDDKVESACMRVADEVWVANYNAPGQVVIAGAPDAIDEASTIAKDLGAKRTMGLPVGGAFHTPFMAPAQDRLRKALDQVELVQPEQPVFANVDGMAHDVVTHWEGLLNSQLCCPVKWRQSLHSMEDAGFTTFVELGPGSVLTSMAKRTLKGSRTLKVNTPADVDALLEALAAPPVGGPAHLDGEALFATERLVVTPCAGVFTPVDDSLIGTVIEAGHLLGTVGANEVRSPFAGEVMGYLAVNDERVTTSQPVAWLRLVGQSESSRPKE